MPAAPAPPPAAADPGFPTEPAGGSPAARVAGSASVPLANRAAPTRGETPPLAPHAQVYQTAAGPPQPVSPPLPTRTPGEHAFPPAPAGAPAAPPLFPHGPGRSPAPAPQQPSGQVSTVPDPANRPPRQRQPGVPVYGDLLQPATVAGAADSPDHPAADPPPPPLWQSPGVPAQADSQPAEIIPATAAAPHPQPAPDPATAEGQPEPPPRNGPPTGLIVGAVLVGATLLVLGALSVPFLLQRLSASGQPNYSVGDCVVQDGINAQLADCGEEGAFEIVAEVDTREECTDPTQPAIEVAGPPVQFYCLAAAGPPPTDTEADADGDGSD